MKKKYLLSILVVLLVSMFTFSSLLRPGYFPMHDDMQAMRVLQMDKCIKDGQIPCRWVPDMGYGYGYPQFIFYSPLPYYVMEGFHLLGLSFLDSVKAGIVLGFLLSGIGMFLLGKILWGRMGGIVSAVFYLYAPFRASDVYSRGAIGEFWALVFLPFIFWSILKYVRHRKAKYFIGFVLSLCGLFLTHNLTTIGFSPFVVLWSLVVLWYFKRWRMVFNLVLGGISAFFLAGFYTIPLLFERKYVHIETLTSGYFDYRQHFVSLKQLFTSTFWGFGSSELGIYDDLSFQVGFVHWLVALLAVITVVIFVRKRRRFYFWASIVLFAMAAISLFMTHQRSAYVWQLVSQFKFFQFPWRFLTTATFFLSVLAGGLVKVFTSVRSKAVLTSVLVLLVVLLNSFYFRPSEWFDIDDTQKFSGENWEKQLTISIFDYLPIYADAPPASRAPEVPQVITGDFEVVDYKKGTNWQKGIIDVKTSSSVVEVPLYYFPGFMVLVDQSPADINYDNPLGLITFEVLQGQHEIDVRLTKTAPRRFGDIFTVISLFALGLWFARKEFYTQ